MKHYDGISWLSEDEYAKLKWQFKAHAREALSVFKPYGMNVYKEGAVEEMFRLAEDFSLRTRGVDKPIDIERIRRELRH